MSLDFPFVRLFGNFVITFINRGKDFFLEINLSETRIACDGHVLTDWDKMSTLYRGPSIDASNQVSVHLAKRFQRRRFKKNRPIKNKNCLWRPCLLMDLDEMSNIYIGPAIDTSYQISDQLALQGDDNTSARHFLLDT